MAFDTRDYVILIPAYKPVYDQMIPFIEELKRDYDKIVCVDDGGGETFSPVFDECKRLGCFVLTHEVNRGKGAALKTGIAYIRRELSDAKGVITADCDGQHTPEDIKKVTEALYGHPDDMIIGGRKFDKNVPFRSQAGNTFTRVLYKLATGISIYDTQTGLRGFPMSLLPELETLEGDRYEYEMNMLLKMKYRHILFLEQPITTVYDPEDYSSHYNAVKDSWRIFKVMFRGLFDRS
jgi:glycosyltransferase involved in cell wall biosynthesis